MTRKAAIAVAADPTSVYVEFVPVDDLIPYAKNARTHSPEQVAQIKTSICEFGWTSPELVDETGNLIAVHGRILAAKLAYSEGAKLAMSNGVAIPRGCVPVLRAIGWSEEKRRAYILADNKIALNAGWDADLLKFEFEELRAVDFDLGLRLRGGLRLLRFDLGALRLGGSLVHRLAGGLGLRARDDGLGLDHV